MSDSNTKVILSPSIMLRIKICHGSSFPHSSPTILLEFPKLRPSFASQSQKQHITAYIFKMSSSTQLKTLHQALTGQLLPKSSELHNHVRQFLQEEIKDFEAVNSKNDQVLDELRQEWDFYNKKTSDVKAKKNKDSKFIEGGAGYLKAKDDEIKAKQKVLESINTGLKESVTKVNPKKIAKLPYSTEPILKEVFSTFYHILYNEPAESFDWSIFVKLALLHEQGEDFITRLANINFKDLQPHHYDALRVLKTDLKFIDVCENSPYAIDIVDLADWIDYVVQGHKVFLQKQACEHDYQKIRKDISKRSDGTTQMSEEFYNDTLKDVDAYQTNLMNLQSQLRTLIIGMNHNLKGLAEIEGRRGEKIHAINSI